MTPNFISPEIMLKINPNMICAFAILLVASIDDVLYRRVHNKLLVALALITLVVIFCFQGATGLKFGALGFLMGFIIYFPLAWFKFLGGGDLKLLAVTGLAVGPSRILWIGIAAFVWGAIMGLIQVIMKGNLKKLLHNTLAIAQKQKVEKSEMHKIPFAVAILLAAISSYVLDRGSL